MEKRKCDNCGREFVPPSRRVKACSLKCGYEARSKRYYAAKPVLALAEPEPPQNIKLVEPVVAPKKRVVPPATREKTPRSRTHLIIPDCQVKAGVPTEHLEWIGRYIAQKRPDVIVCLGDFADMPSLSSYDKGKKAFEGRRYKIDIAAARAGMERLTAPFVNLKDYKPEMVLTLGNHEDRITRAVNDAAMLEGWIGLEDLGYEAYGWKVIPYLEIIRIDGISYSHYFTTGVMGRPCGSAAVMLREVAGSAVCGHNQHTDLAYHRKTQRFALMAGICYLHDEEYLGMQGNNSRRQIVMLHEVEDGLADPMFVSLNYLARRFGTVAA